MEKCISKNVYVKKNTTFDNSMHLHTRWFPKYGELLMFPIFTCFVVSDLSCISNFGNRDNDFKLVNNLTINQVNHGEDPVKSLSFHDIFWSLTWLISHISHNFELMNQVSQHHTNPMFSSPNSSFIWNIFFFSTYRFDLDSFSLI